MRKTNKLLVSLAIAGTALGMFPFNAFAASTVPTRLSGVTAAETAVAIADQTGWTGTAILASSASYGMVDALTAGPLASFLNAPILLQEPGAVLNSYTEAELTKLEVKKVYVTSGTAVISQAVLNKLKDMGIEVVSLGGADRFETSVNIAKKMVELGAPVTKVAVAYGWLNQDALSIASIAAANNEPILLTDKNSIPTSVKTFLDDTTDVTATDVIGGTGVISDAVKDQFPSANRYFGNTAYDTNVAVLKAFDDVVKYDNVFLANGETAIDALAGAPLAAEYKAGIVLTNGATNEGTTYASSKLSASGVVTALGGTAVVPDNVLTSVVHTLTPLEVATAAVVTAEASKTQADVDAAKALVNALPEDVSPATDKQDLLTRLDAIQVPTALDLATAAVVKAETSKTQADVDAAKDLVNALPEDVSPATDKQDLLTRLDAIQVPTALDLATAAVEKAEASKTQADVDAAKALVNALPEDVSPATDKQDLLTRLDAIQVPTALDLATAAVVKAETSKTQADVDAAKDLVNALPADVSPATDKQDLLTRLDAIQVPTALDLATAAVEQAETSKTQADVDAAKALVNALPEDVSPATDKQDLLTRLDAITVQ